MNKKIFFLIIILYATYSCKQSEIPVSTSEMNELVIPNDQFQAENMELGFLSKVLFNEGVHFNGKVMPSQNQTAKLHVPLDGIVKKILFQTGEQINKNELLLEIGGNPLIDLEKNFFSTASELKLLKANFERSQKLLKENIQTEQEFLLAESNFKSKLAMYNAAKIKLTDLGLNPDEIENGEFKNTYQLKSPIEGQLIELNATLGQYVSTDDFLGQIVNTKKPQLVLNLFEKDLPKIKIGQTVQFTPLSFPDIKFYGNVKRITNLINPRTNACECYATINHNPDFNLLINQVIEGEIIIDQDSVLAVPQHALITENNNHFVLVLKNEENNEYTFEKQNVKTARVYNEFVELTDFPLDKKILVSDNYNFH